LLKNLNAADVYFGTGKKLEQRKMIKDKALENKKETVPRESFNFVKTTY